MNNWVRVINNFLTSVLVDMMKLFLRLNLADLDAAIFSSCRVCVAPLCAEELRAVYYYFGIARFAGVIFCSSNDIDSRAEAKHKTGILSVKDKVATSKENFARRRNRHDGLYR